MEDEIKELKSVLRSLVVSSPTQVDVRTLMRDYRSLVGRALPIAKLGYKEPVHFLRERCSDCFLFHGDPRNPVLTLIVPDTLKHIDKFVQKQKVSNTVKHKGKRRSVAALVSPPSNNLISKTFLAKEKESGIIKKEERDTVKNDLTLDADTENNQVYNGTSHSALENFMKKRMPLCTSTADFQADTDSSRGDADSGRQTFSNANTENNQVYNGTSHSALENFMKKRMPLCTSTADFQADTDSSRGDADSGRQTFSSGSSTKWTQFEELKSEIKNILEDHPEGIWCTDLVALYRQRHGRELQVARFGFTSVLCRCAVTHLTQLTRTGIASDATQHKPSRHTASEKRRVVLESCGVCPQDPDVFPEDCVHFMESIPAAPLAGVAAGAHLEVIVGEVYSPSHFWLIRLGEQHSVAMEDMMDEMTEYYSRGAGCGRRLARGAVRVGQYCSSCYEGDWHRSLIVKLVDSDTVKDDIVEVLLIDTSSDEDVCINTEMVRAGYADPRDDSCLGVSVAPPAPRPPRATSSSSASSSGSESDEEAMDVRSLATIIAHFERRTDTDTDSEISASASEVRGPRRLPPWPRDHSPGGEAEVEEEVASVVSHTSLHLARITALHTKLQRATGTLPKSLHLARLTALHSRRAGAGARGRGAAHLPFK
ncbi:hypothetical protein RR48_09511 [Papilio machaon]|uniref:HTH OST-type domain-containing protein n=1 Tax=Papilio machaon TaxID=76193 RepID=A0A194QY31_PAPMA|nr:hypothetical protein RR48_09511 [Papilio machaon]